MNMTATTTVTNGISAPLVPNKGFGTGKGTTARVKTLFEQGWPLTVAEAASALGLPSRQLHKRFAELVKAGFLKLNGTHNGVKDYRKA